MEALKQDGVEIQFHTLLAQLFRDPNGRVVGIAVRRGHEPGKAESGTVKTIKALNGVVLACGGFAADLNFRVVQDPRLTRDSESTNQPGATVEGLIAALRVDAAPVQLSWIQLIPLTSPDDEGFGDGCGFIAGSGMTHGVLVDPTSGLRFIGERADRKIQSDAIIACGHPAITIADSHGVKVAWWGVERSVKQGTVKKFDTIAHSAAAYEIDATVPAETIETFNAYVKAKSDPDFGKLIVDEAKPIVEGPFYAAHVWPKVHHTMGGVEINASAEVLDLNGAVIPGLYTAGEITGGIHGGCRLGSVAIIDCLVFGRIAGRNAGRKAIALAPAA